MKKTLSILLVIALIVLTLPLGLFEFNASAGATYKYETTADGVIITEVADGASGNIIIPSKLSTRPIIRIEDNAFYDCDGVTGITVPDSITSIGELAFSDCDNLESITLGKGVTVISKGAFADCVKLEKVVLNGEITEIGDHAFANCTSLVEFDIPSSVESIGEAAFSYCSGIKSFVVGDNTTVIGDYAFGWCSQLRSATLGDGITSLGEGMFFACDKLTDIAFCDGVTDIYDFAFYGCDALENVWYTGSYGDENDISIGIENDALVNADWNCIAYVFEQKATGVYDITPNPKPTGFTTSSITVLDKNYNEVKYNSAKAGWPLVSGQKYTIKFNEELNYSKNLDWKLTKKADTIFSDTDKSGWYNDAVTYAVGAGIISGYGGTTKFGTADNIQRQDFLVILARLDGVDLDDYKYKSKFPDVERNSYYEAAVNWGAENKIVTGYENGKFGVGDKVTREQLVTFLYRYATNYKGIDTSVTTAQKNQIKNKYDDYKNVSDFAKEAILWAATKGVINGKTEKTIVPQGNAQRCEVAKIMYNIYLNDIF